jgi:hypothetical protein
MMQYFTSVPNDRSFHLDLIDDSMIDDVTDESPKVPSSRSSSSASLLNTDLIRSALLKQAPWAESHGANHDLYLGAGMFYYSLAYSLQASTVVVLGSGGGFVPRMLRQAQRDLARAGIDQRFELVLIDAHLASAGWGSTFYAENDDSVMRQQFADIRYIFKTTDEAVKILRKENVSIDYLHIDADHSFVQSWKDFTNYVSLLGPRGVVTFHDTCTDEKRKCRTGVPQTIATLRDRLDDYQMQLLDMPYLYRGIAVAMRREAPALETPSNRRFNFCKNNAAELHRTSPGWSLNKRHGALATLGDFYDCFNRFDAADLGIHCPVGKRRRVKDGQCECIPGMIGKDCQDFEYAKQREIYFNATELDPFIEGQSEETQRHLLASAWLAQHRSQHILEVGFSFQSVTDSLLHEPLSVHVVDPLLKMPTWTEPGTVPVVRRLPVRYKDLLGLGYSSEVQIANTDAIVCWDCSSKYLGGDPLRDLLSETALTSGVAIIVVEGPASEEHNRLDRMVSSLTKSRAWTIRNDVVLDSPLARKRPGTDSTRRMILLTKS